MKNKQIFLLIFLIFITSNLCANNITNSIKQISAGIDYTLALKEDGSVWAWGKNNCGQLGDGTTTNKSIPVPLTSIDNVKLISTAYHHSLALTNNFKVWAWGNNYKGQLGDGTKTSKTTPVQVSKVDYYSFTLISAGLYHSLALRYDGKAFAWGDNYYGQLGTGLTSDEKTPHMVHYSSIYTLISAGRYHSLALQEDGTVWAWGCNNCGQLGDGTTSDKRTYVQVSGIDNITSISTGDDHNLALKKDGTVWAWGDNYYGQLGDGTTSDKITPVQVSGIDNVKLISAGIDHSHAIKKDGTVWAWGRNDRCQLGDGTRSHKTIPVQVSGVDSVQSLFKGYDNTFALNNDGSLWAWGDNSYKCIDYICSTHIKTPIPVLHFFNTAIFTKSHPDSKKWFISNTIEIETIETIIPYGFYFNIDNNEDTKVFITNSTYESTSRTTVAEDIAIAHGSHYFHFSRSNSDYWPTETLHFQYNHFNQQLIVESETHPHPNHFYPLPDISLNIKNLKPGIIIRYIIDQNQETIPNTSSPSKNSEQFFLDVRSPGTYYLHLRAEDSLGNIAPEELTTHFKFNLSKQPIASTTHPINTEWSPNNDVQINIAGWKTGMKYCYVVNNQSDGVPVKNSNIISSKNASINIPFPGINYIHVRAIDPQGNIFPEDSTSHYRVNIIPTLPKIESTTHPNQNEWYTLPNIAIVFIHTAENIKLRYIVNEQPGTIPDDSASLKSSKIFVLPGQSPGSHYIHIRAEHSDGTLDPAYLTAHFRYNLLARGESPPTALPKIDNLSVTPTMVSNSESITIQADVIIDK